MLLRCVGVVFFFFQAEDGIRDYKVTGVQTCALPILVAAALPLWVILAPIVDAAETGGRIWDPDLKRYLTEEELGKVEVYLTEEQALKLLFPKSQTIKAEELRLTSEQKARIQERIGWKFPEESFRAFKAETNGKVDGYAV